MDIMTQIGLTEHSGIVQALREDIQMADSGIDMDVIEADWGVTLKLKRQGRTLPWRITMNRAGLCGIYKPPTATIPRVEIATDRNEHLKVRDYLLDFINAGLI